MWWSIVCSLSDNDIHHHGGQNVVCLVSPQQILTIVMTNILVDKSTDMNHIRLVFNHNIRHQRKCLFQSVIKIQKTTLNTHKPMKGVNCSLQGGVAGARFWKVPKPYGPLSAVTILFVSQERRGFKSSNFIVIFLFATLKTC